VFAYSRKNLLLRCGTLSLLTSLAGGTGAQEVAAATETGPIASEAAPQAPGAQPAGGEGTVEPGQNAGALQEIVVTAQKRTTTVQSTPISIEAVNGDDLQSKAVPDLATLAQSMAGVSLKSEGPGQTEIEMRGMVSSGGNSPTVGFYLDDVPLTPPAGAQNGKVVISPSLYDLGRIEVLRGPQGTLYGSGSMGGTVRLITNQPDTGGFHASAQSILSETRGGGFNHTDNFMVNVPLISDSLALRLVGSEAYTSGWIDRIVAAPNTFPIATDGGSTRGDVQAAPVAWQDPHSNADHVQSLHASLLWKASADLTVTPSVTYLFDRQNGISAFDSVPGTETHYEPFNVPEAKTDRIGIEALTIDYSLGSVDVTSSTAYWSRLSTQVEDGSEDFNNPLMAGATCAAAGTTCVSNPNGSLPNPGYYGPSGTGIVSGYEYDPTRQFSEELRLASKPGGAFEWVAGAYWAEYWSTWTFNGTSLNPSNYMDLGTFNFATTTNWFDADSPTGMHQYALFGDGTYKLSEALHVDGGLRLYRYDYNFSSTIAGWGSGHGAATPSASGLITQTAAGLNPKLNVSYDFDKNVMGYVTVARGFRPGGGNAVYPTGGPVWGPAFAAYDFPSGKWPSTYRPDFVWSYEVGEKARLFDRRLTFNTSFYYEDWQHIQLLAFPGDWALNINGNDAKIYGGDIETKVVLGGGFVVNGSVGVTHYTLDAGPFWEITPKSVLPDLAPVNGNLGLTYAKDLAPKYTLTAQAEYAFVGPRYSISFLSPNYPATGVINTNGAYQELPSYSLTNLRVGINSEDGWGATLFVTNVFNRHAQLENLFQETLPSAAFNRVITNQPLTAGINLSYHM
jgi:outer membrane receptor protein involved in Fe transport